MEREGARKVEKILVLDHSDGEIAKLLLGESEVLPAAEVFHAQTLEQYQNTVEKDGFDLVLLNHELVGQEAIHALHALRVKDQEPAVVMVSKELSPQEVAEFYNAGCAKCVVEHEGWLAELAPAIRHVLRIKRLEEENQRLLIRLTEANQLLQEKNHRLDEFSASLAHDIRGPLGGISMKLEYLMDHYEQGLDERFAELLKRSMASTQRLTKIVQAMYEFAKLGAKAAVMQPVNLKELISECVSDLHFDEHLNITLGLSALPTVWGNADLLRRVFINLITNAVKYNDKEQIVINIYQERILEKGIAPYAEICVEDNGPGIPQEEQATIFQMFSRGQEASKLTGEEGSGIGLAVVSRIVELHFGNVRLESSPAKGSKFLLSLPMEQIDFLK